MRLALPKGRSTTERRSVLLALLVAGGSACSPGPTCSVSTSTELPPELAPHLVVRASGITLDGLPIVPLTSGTPSDEHTQGLLIRPVRDALVADPGEPETDDIVVTGLGGKRILVEIEPDLSAALLSSVLHSAAEAGYSSPWLVVDGPIGRAGISVRVPSPKVVNAALSPDSAPKTDPAQITGYANPIVTIRADRSITLEARDKVYGTTLDLLCSAPCTSEPSEQLNRIARRLKLDHPRDRAVLVQAEDTATVQSVVEVLDATRSDAVTSQGARSLFPIAIVTAGVE